MFHPLDTDPIWPDRAQIVSDYYQTPLQAINEIYKIASDKDNLKRLALEHKLDPYILRTMLAYTRYPEAREIYLTLDKMNVSIKGLTVLDFGCLAADYGLFFASHGAKVTIYDYRKFTDFARFRFDRNGLKIQILNVPVEYPALFKNKDLVIFGEVLEHFHDPLTVLKTCIDQKVKFIFSSCYPFGDIPYFELSGHRRSAYDQQPACQELLNRDYNIIRLEEERRMWVLRKWDL